MKSDVKSRFAVVLPQKVPLPLTLTLINRILLQTDLPSEREPMAPKQHRLVGSLLMATVCLIVFRRPLFVYDAQNLAHVEHTSLYAWLEKVASYATDSYLFEEVLIHKLQEASCVPSLVTTLDRVLFVVMCSSDKQERVGWLSQTWLAWVPPRNVVLLSDTMIPGYNVTLLPSLPGDAYVKTKFPNPNNYDAANLRHLLSVQC